MKRKKLIWIPLLIPLIICLAIVPIQTAKPPPPAVHTLTVESNPFTGVEFTINETAYTTSVSVELEEGNYTVAMSSAWILSTGDVYDFDVWEDGSTDAVRVVNLNDTMTIIANYTRATFSVDSDPQGIEFTIDGVTHTTPWSEPAVYGTYEIEVPRWITFLGRPHIFDYWENENPNLTRSVEVEAGTPLTALYGFAYNITTLHPATVYIDPPLIEDPDATEITVDIVVSPFVEEVQWFSQRTHEVRDAVYTPIPIEHLWGVQFTLEYNPRILNGISKTVNLEFLGSLAGIEEAMEIPGPGFDDEAGVLGLFGMYLETLDSDVAPAVEEATVLATVAFGVVDSGVTGLCLGDETNLMDPEGVEYPRELACATFRNADAQLWMGPEKGGKIWPAWKHGSVGEPQILYGRFTNLGDGAVYAHIRFTVASAIIEESVWSNEVWIEPGETVTVSAVYEPPGPGAYTVRGAIEFKYDGVTYIDYSTMSHIYDPETGEPIAELLGGDGVTRDIGTKFWVG